MKTGATFNGKPVYCKAYHKDVYSAPIGGGTFEIGDLPANLESAVQIVGNFVDNTPTGNRLCMPYQVNSYVGGAVTTGWSLYCWINSGGAKINLDVKCVDVHAYYDINVVLYYTKTTD